MASYNAVKAGVVAFTETLGHELAEYGVTAHVVCPSYFRTGLVDAMRGGHGRSARSSARWSRTRRSGPTTSPPRCSPASTRGEELILPDDGRAGRPTALKLTDRPAYDAVMRAQAARLDAMGARGVTEPIAGAGAVREEDAFDVEAVRTWLAARAPARPARSRCGSSRGGASNLTYSLRTAARDLILRRPPAGQKAKGAHDMGREFRIQAGAAPSRSRWCPQMVALCEDESVIGSEFYVMQRIDGIIPRRDFPPEVHLDEAGVATLCTNALDVLVDLHRVDIEPPELAALGKGTGYVAPPGRGLVDPVPQRPHRRRPATSRR